MGSESRRRYAIDQTPNQTVIGEITDAAWRRALVKAKAGDREQLVTMLVTLDDRPNSARLRWQICSELANGLPVQRVRRKRASTKGK